MDVQLNSTERGRCGEILVSHGVAMMTLNIGAALLGTVGNLLVCGSVLTTHSLRTNPTFILVSLAVADLLVAVLAQPLFVAFLAASIRGTCAHILELLFRLVANASCGASVLHLCLISIERCIVVLRPYNFREIITKRRLGVVLTLAWLFPIIYAVLRLTISKRFTSYFTVVVLALNVVIIIVCYALIVTRVRKQRRMSSTRSRNRKSRDKVQRRVTMTIAIVIILFVVCWFPLIFLRSLRASDNDGPAYDWARTLSLINSAMNPWVYCFRMRDFRAAYKRLFMECHWKVIKKTGRKSTDESEERNQSDSYQKNSVKKPAQAAFKD